MTDPQLAILPTTCHQARTPRWFFGEEGKGTGYVHEANRYEQGGNLLGACAVHGCRDGAVDQVPRPLSGPWYVELVVDHSYRGDLDHAACGHQGWLLHGRLEVSGPAPSGSQRLVDRLRGDLAHNRGRLGYRVGHPACLLRRARGRHHRPYPQLSHLFWHVCGVVRPRRRDRDARLLAAPPHVFG